MLSDRRALGFKDVLIRPEWSSIRSRKDVSLERTFRFNNGRERTFIPIIASNMKGIGTIETAKVLSKHRMLTCMDKSVTMKDYDHYIDKYWPDVIPYVIPTLGLDEFDLLEEIAFRRKPGLFDIVCLDVANGYMNRFIQYVDRVVAVYPDIVFIAGNVATKEGAKDLSDRGVSAVKIGLGSGSACTTRYKTGVGIPQITAIAEISRDFSFCIQHTPPFIVSDGGCTSPGDVAKAFVAGADFVMLGGMFAGTVETGARLSGSAWGNTESYKTSEGKDVNLTVSETLEQRVNQILGGLRSTGSYIGKDKIEDFYKAELVQVNEQTNDWFGLPN